jgi:hypothetical protein
MKHLYTVIAIIIALNPLFSQTDSSKVKSKSSFIGFKNDSSVLFQSKKTLSEEINSEPKLLIDAYLSTYYASYTEDNTSEFVKYPTMAARNNQFGLNMAMVSLSYKSKKVRSTITLHYGDIAASTWPAKYNLIQEANAGVELVKNLWFDVGVFRTHIGLESSQPRENITSSMSLANVYEPYYLTGAKLTYLIGSKFSIQLNAFNSFNSIVETNKNKLFGASLVYAPNKNLSVTYNFITGDDTPDNIALKHQRYYHNLFLTYQKNKIIIGAEVNYGMQESSRQVANNVLGTAYMNSSLIVLKHQTFAKVAVYGRGEWFSDKDEILSAGAGMGNYTWGATAGIEFKPLKNIAISLEARQLNADKSNVMYNGKLSHQRLEGIFCMDVWF